MNVIAFLALLLLQAHAGCPYLKGSQGRLMRSQSHARMMGSGSGAKLGGTPPLDELNALTQSYYSTNGDLLVGYSLEQDFPLVILGDTLTLYANNQTFTTTIPQYPTESSDIKLCAHTALATIIMLQPSLQMALDNGGSAALLDCNREQILTYLQTLPDAIASISSLNLTQQQIDRNVQLLTSVQTTLENVINTNIVNYNNINQWAYQLMNQLIEDDISDANSAALNAIHTQMMAWKQILTPQQWSSMRVIVFGAHMARKNSNFMQYFGRLLDTKSDSEARVMYTESSESDDNGMPFLAVHLMDYSVGQAFFNNPLRMHYDLLGDAATAYLPTLLPGYPDPDATPSDGYTLTSGEIGGIVIGSISLGVFLGVVIMYLVMRKVNSSAHNGYVLSS